MGTLSYDFTTFSTGALSAHADWGDDYNGGADVDNNGGSNNVSNEATSGLRTTRILTSKGTYARKQYAEVVIGANPSDNASVGPGCYLDASGNGYFLRMYDLNDLASGADNRLYQVAAGTGSDLNWMSNQIIGVGDKCGLLVELSGTVDTKLTFFYNPTTYDGDGFPTNGELNNYTDTASAFTSGQAGIVTITNTGSIQSFVTDFYSAGFTIAGGTEPIPNGALTLSGQTAKRIVKIREKIPEHGT